MKRKKIPFNVLGLFVVSAIALVVLFLLGLNRLIAANRSLILARVQQAMGRKVGVHEIDASLWRGVGISLKGVFMADDPEFSEGSFFDARELVLRLKLAPLLSRRIEVGSLLLIEPRFKIIRNADGRFNFASLTKREKALKEDGEKKKKPGVIAALPRQVADLEIRDAEVLFEDRIGGSPKELALRRVNLTLKSGGPSSPTRVSLQLGLFQPLPNLTLLGEVRLPADEQKFDPGRIGLNLELEGKKFRMDLLRDSLSDLKSLFPPALDLKGPVNFRVSAKGDLSRVVIQGNLDGRESAIRYGSQFEKPKDTPFLLKWRAFREPWKIGLSEGEITVGKAHLRLKGDYVMGKDPSKRTIVYTLESPVLPLALLASQSEQKDDAFTALSASGRLEVGGPHVVSIQAREAKYQGLDLTSLRTAIQITGKEVMVENLAAGLYDGTLVGKATYTDRGSSPVFRVDLKLAGVDLSKLLRARVQKDQWKISGKLDASLKASGNGRAWGEVEESLVGRGVAEVKGGTIQDFNLIRAVLSKATGFADVSESLAKRTQPKYRHLFENKDTKFEALKLDYEVSRGKILADELIMQSPDYAMNAKGWIGFDRKTSLHSTLLMSEAFSADMVADHKSASLFANSEGRLFVPFKLTGTLPRLRPELDSAYFSNLAEKALIQRALDRSRRKVKKIEGDQAEEKTEEVSPRKKERPERELLRRALEGLLERQTNRPTESK